MSREDVLGEATELCVHGGKCRVVVVVFISN